MFLDCWALDPVWMATDALFTVIILIFEMKKKTTKKTKNKKKTSQIAT